MTCLHVHTAQGAWWGRNPWGSWEGSGGVPGAETEGQDLPEKGRAQSVRTPRDHRPRLPQVLQGPSRHTSGSPGGCVSRGRCPARLHPTPPYLQMFPAQALWLLLLELEAPWRTTTESPGCTFAGPLGPGQESCVCSGQVPLTGGPRTEPSPQQPTPSPVLAFLRPLPLRRLQLRSRRSH